MTAKNTYSGRCHCGAVHYTAQTNLDSLMSCNCSRCRRLGWVMQPVPAENFNLLSGAGHLTLYRFNTNTIDHLFCKTCGIESFGRGLNEKGEETVMINVNCLDDAPPVDPGVVTHWDGAKM